MCRNLLVLVLSFIVLVSRESVAFTARRQSLLDQGSFSCQGKSIEVAMVRTNPYSCDDEGAQLQSSGGNVTVLIEFAQNMKRMDVGWGPAAGTYGESDPYVKITYGKEVRTSKAVPNVMKNAWYRQKVNLGFLNSGTELAFEMWNENIGFLGSDELMYGPKTVRVPYCSMFPRVRDHPIAQYRQANCTKQYKGNVPWTDNYTPYPKGLVPYDERARQYGCEADDSLWHDGNRLQCRESGYVNFAPQKCDGKSHPHCDANGKTKLAGLFGALDCGPGWTKGNEGTPCLKITFITTPLQVEVDYQDPAYYEKITFSVSGKSSGFAPWSQDVYTGSPYDPVSPSPWAYQRPYGEVFRGLMIQGDPSADLEGALIVQQDNLKAEIAPIGQVKFYLAVNFPVTVYVCRAESDWARGSPSWLEKENYKNERSLQKFYVGANEFQCMSKDYPGTVKNRWHGTENGAIPFYSNKVKNVDIYSYKYAIFIQPKTTVKVQDTVDVSFAPGIFFQLFLQHGLLSLYFVWLVRRYWNKIDYRLDRVSTDMVSKKFFGPNKTIMASLWLQKDNSPLNVYLRSHIYHSTLATYFIMTFPFLFVFNWGLQVSYFQKPKSVGYFVMYIGCAVLCFGLGVRSWQAQGWRMNKLSLVALGAGITCIMLFLCAVVFGDPMVTDHGAPVDFAALSVIFGTFEGFILLSFIFRQNKAYVSNMGKVLKHLDFIVSPPNQEELENMTESEKVMLRRPGENSVTVAESRPSTSASTGKQDTKEKVKQRASPSVNRVIHSLLQHAYTLHPLCPQFNYGTVLDENLGKVAEGAGTVEDSFYLASCFVRFIYFCTSLDQTAYGGVAFLNCCYLFLFDYIHAQLERGGNEWSPYSKIVLILVGRMTVMSSGGERWLLTYSLAYIAYSFALSTAAMEDIFPMPTMLEMQQCAFTGQDPIVKEKQHDISGTPGYLFGILTFTFSIINVISASTGSTSTVFVRVLGSVWPIYVVAIIAVFVVVAIAIVQALLRCVELERRNSLEPWMKEIFFLRGYVNITWVLGILTVIISISLGAVIYGTTGSALILICAIFIPPIVLCLNHTLTVWIKNDYDLVIWPRPDDIVLVEDMEEVQSLAIEEVEEFDEKEQEEEIGATLKTFQVPTLAVTDHKSEEVVKMPALPMKSALRAKRKKMGIVAKQILVKDLRGREGADGEKFGGADEDVVDINDPWAQFRDSESEDEMEEFEIIDPSTGMSTKKARKKPKVVKAKTGLNVIEVDDSIWDNPHVKIVLNALVKAKEIMVPIVIKAMHDFSDFIHTLSERLFRALTDDHGSDDYSEGEEGVDKPKKSAKPFLDALLDGDLNYDEKLALGSWFGGLFLIMIMGIVMGELMEPPWLGGVFFYGSTMFLCTAVPMVKYFNTYKVDSTMKQFMFFGFLYHFMFSICFWGGYLQGDVTSPAALWIVDYFLYFPIFAYVAFELYKWKDSGWVIEPMDKNGDGKLTKWEILVYLKVYPIFLCMMIILNVQVYFWIDHFLGIVMTLFLLLGAVMYFFVRDWATNDFYVSPQLAKYGKQLLEFTIWTTGFIIMEPIGMFPGDNIMLTVTVFTACLSFRSILHISSILVDTHAESVYFFSPYVMPVYSYDTLKNDLITQLPLMSNVVNIGRNVLLWAFCLSMFYHPVYPGVAVSCYFILFIAAACVACNQSIPGSLLELRTMITPQLVQESANAATELFAARKIPFTLEIPGWNGNDAQVYHARTELERLKEQSALTIAMDLNAQQVKKFYTKAIVLEEKKGSAKKSKKKGSNSTGNEKMEDGDDDDEDDTTKWYVKMWRSLKQMFLDYTWIPLLQHVDAVKEWTGVKMPPGYEKHGEGLFCYDDVLAEAVIAARGGFGFLGVEGYLYKYVMRAMDTGRYKFLHMPWLYDYDENGNYRKAALLPDRMDHITFLESFLDKDKALAHNYAEEFRAGAHFLVMMLVGAEAKFQREKILFQKFLREGRQNLAKNGIMVPTKVFRTSSYASVNIPEIALWLISLDNEARHRFHSMKAIFTLKGYKLDEAVDDDDYDFEFNASKLKRERAERERIMIAKIQMDIVQRKERRIDQWVATLIRAEQMKFTKFRKLWTSGADVFIDSLDIPLYDKFKESQERGVDEITDYAWECLEEIENVERDCVRGAYGRNFQFVDPDFSPNIESIGECPEAEWILGWRCAPGVNRESTLINSGTDADDVEVGVFHNGWLLSAIMMLASIGDEGEDKIEVLNSFIGRKGPGGITYSSKVGAYCVRLFKRGMWIPLVLDDLFPMLQHDYWTESNAGMAVAHSAYCRELWVALLEKAFAKFLGSYAELNRGYVHHALEDLTACDSLVIPLARQGRGSGKLHLWDQLIQFHRNGYILGAGTGKSELVEKDVLDMGIVFDACYVIFKVVLIDGLKLIKMRNPPGDHEEWKGDWSDKSPLWTKRLKHKLQMVDADDNMFWMSFDDFCNVFRHLYVCKWLKPSKWRKVGLASEWKLSTELEYTEKKMLKEMMTAGEEVEVDQEAEMRDLARSRVNTAGGIPTRHNLECKVENNPHFALTIHRPTDLKVTLNQVDRRGMARDDPHPAAIFICRLPPGETSPQRLITLDEDNIVIHTGEPKALRSQSLYCSLQPGVYIVITATYLAEMTGCFDCLVCSNYKCEFDPVYPPRWMTKGGREVGNGDSFAEELARQKLGEQKAEKRNNVMKKVRRVLVDIFGTGTEDVGEPSDSSSDEDDDIEMGKS